LIGIGEGRKGDRVIEEIFYRKRPTLPEMVFMRDGRGDCETAGTTPLVVDMEKAGAEVG
jgi:hypothetical protein